ncbi:MAG: glycosyl hydrolase [Rhodobacterales bacterium]|nr:MAG: glycosyl hydrolase [Rhodobacterales bacterium]
MSARFEVEVKDREIHCTITVGEALSRPVFCFSLMAPGEVISGGKPVGSLGGHLQVALPDLVPGRPHEVVVAYRRKRYPPVNRAWLPLGPYLRHAGGILPLPPIEAGVRTGKPPAPKAAGANRLMLCPPPTAAALTGGTIDATRGFACDHEAFAAIARIKVRARVGDAPFLAPDGLPVRIVRDGALPPEGYFLVLDAQGVTLSVRDRAGVLYGAVTLRHLQITHGGRIPAARIADAPRFGWRGQQLDCARNFQSVETILRLLDLMALLKLNRFHWHFADDEAFRLEVACYPELWQKTAFRGEGEMFPGFRGGGPRAGGSYSREDVGRILAHAERLNIEVMPEIEMPAHCFALTQVIPGLRDPADSSIEGSSMGYTGNTVNPAMEKTWEVLPRLATEVAGWFPFGHLHLGCDELSKSAWKRSPAVAALKAKLRLSTNDDVQGWMMARMAAHLARDGIRPAAWHEARKGRNGGIGNGAILFSWLGQSPGVEAARAGYDVVMCPAQHAYLDMAHTWDRDDWGANGVGSTALEKTVGWDPVPEDAGDIARRVLGVQGNFWSEFTTGEDQLWPMLMPRLMGVAASAWSQRGALDGPGLRALSDGYRASMEGFWGWNHRA